MRFRRLSLLGFNLIFLLCGCAISPAESGFVPDGARAFKAQLRNPTGAPGILIASQVYRSDAVIIGEGELEASGKFTFAFVEQVPEAMLEKPSTYCPELIVSDPEAGIVFVHKLALLSEDAEILGDVAQAASTKYLKGTAERGELGIYAYVDTALRLEGSCPGEVNKQYELRLKQGWNAVKLDAGPTQLSYSSAAHTLPWFFLGLE